jgi:hypothetical protein
MRPMASLFQARNVEFVGRVGFIARNAFAEFQAFARSRMRSARAALILVLVRPLTGQCGLEP